MNLVTGDRRRLLHVLALVTAGALLGAGIVAWRSDTLPLFSSKPCWDSVTDQDVEELLGDRDTEASGIRPAWVDDGELQGSCRLMPSDERPRGLTVDIGVHKLDGLDQDQIPWANEFLSTRLTPLSGKLLGMASDTRAWVAMPDACTGEPGDFSGPGVVDVALGDDESSGASGAHATAHYQRALARTAVHVANGTMEELGCTGSLESPQGLKPVPRKFRPMPHSRQMCDLKGVRLPTSYLGSHPRMRASVTGTDGKSPVHGCEIATGVDPRPTVRLRTVQEEDVTGAFGHTVVELGHFIRGKKGSREATGTFSGTTAALRVECPKGVVDFMADDRHDTGNHQFIKKVFPSYVSSEAERLDCGPVKIRMLD